MLSVQWKVSTLFDRVFFYFVSTILLARSILFYFFNKCVDYDGPLSMARFRRSLIHANTCLAESMTPASSL